ncbi:MAG TPA: carboxypeptidase-like regulatory domain-containing protein, partial [Pyrinomonadaceae bacterium]|nr:carboxypeptidase-like regulatory domain-containing protein [Pyrinomonadaceae bacterium]
QGTQSPNSASLKGRAVNLLGRGIEAAEITLSSQNSNVPIMVITDKFGNFEFPNTPVDQSYTLVPRAPRCVFQQPQMTINFTDPDTGVLLRANCFRLIR